MKKRLISIILAAFTIASLAPTALTAQAVLSVAISVGETKTAVIGAERETAYFAFTPAEDGKYTFSSISDRDTCGFVCDDEMNKLAESEIAGDDTNFSVSYIMTAGTAYILGACYYYGFDTGSFDVTLEKEDDFYYSVDGGCATVTQYNSTGGDVAIPSELGGYPVTRIGDYAFKNCAALTSVTIPESVTDVAVNAFRGCSGLGTITVAAGNVVYYSDGNCLIETESGTVVLGCKGSVIPDGVTAIGVVAFENCAGLTSVVIPDGVTVIGDAAFSCCGDLASVTIADGVTHIGRSAFYNTALYNDGANWDNGVLYIGKHLIEAEYSISGDCAIKDGTLTVADYAFTYCDKLTSLTLPGSVTNIGECAVFGCSSLAAITVADGNAVYHSAGNCLIETSTGKLILGCNNSVIPDDGSLTCICDYAFYKCNGLASATVPEGVTVIGTEAFYYCKGLASVTIPESLTDVGAEAFYGCSALAEVYYAGSGQDWNAISFGSDNLPLLNATITFGKESEVIAGDLDGDESVTSDDAIYLLYHTLLPELYPVPENINCDFDNDGVVTSDDAIYLLYYTLLPDMYPLYPEHQNGQGGNGNGSGDPDGDGWSPFVQLP